MLPTIALVEHRQRQREQHDADQDRLHRQVLLGVRDEPRRAGARGREAAAGRRRASELRSEISAQTPPTSIAPTPR